MYVYEDQEGRHRISRQEILKVYFNYWCKRMKIVGREHLITEENCIEDFCTVHWAHEE